MSGDRRKEIRRHLSEERIGELLREAEDDRRKERLGFLKISTVEIRLENLPTARAGRQRPEGAGQRLGIKVDSKD